LAAGIASEMSNGKKRNSVNLRDSLSDWFSLAEDAIYVGLGLLLIAIAITLLITEVVYFAQYVSSATLADNVVFLLDRILLIIIFVEVLYTVQVSFRQHILRPEPFLVVGLIAVTRRVLVLTGAADDLDHRIGGMPAYAAATGSIQRERKLTGKQTGKQALTTVTGTTIGLLAYLNTNWRCVHGSFQT
jgi:uncharacterized membrane protein (DUF373 family)